MRQQSRGPTSSGVLLSAIALVLALMALVIALTSCARSDLVPGAEPTTFEPQPQPVITFLEWIDPPWKPSIDQTPWCLTSSGVSPIYPCKWDARLRAPYPAWGSQLPPVALFVRRSQGCIPPPVLVREPFGCFWAPVDRGP